MVAVLSSLLLLFILFVAFYLFAATVMKWVPSNRHAQTQEEGIDIWVVSNGPHSDLILPLRSEEIDWTEFIDTQNFKPADVNYVSFGWGDKGFYLETPSWAKLKPKTAFKALFKLSRTTMQVVLFEDVPEDYKWKKKIRISAAQYQSMIQYIKRSFRYTDQGEIMHIDFAGMPAYEKLNYNFYEAQGRYHFLKTCNCWVNNALKEAEIRTAMWAPFSKAIFHQLDKLDGDSENYMTVAVDAYSPRLRHRLRNFIHSKMK